MAVINLLSPHLADLIAAGEVVERPASVIKELLENSFDAGAKSVICEIRNGGMTYIRVTDDGCGMAPEDAGVAFLRHATSKLSDEAGLEAISTMGFRGEALAAISSVSRIELITRLQGASAGTRVTLEAGDIQDMESFGCPDGTTMIVRDIFYNTPARLKFMKSDRTEASACEAAALRCALGRPDVSVRFIRDGSEEFFSPGDGRIDSCLYALLGRNETASMLKCTSSAEGMKLRGYVSSPSEGRGNRAHQFFFVNGRYIKSTLLQSALEQAYKNTLLSSRYPSCALYLDLSFNSVDVNVHPAKTEIRFGSEKTIFDFVYHAVRFALEGESRLSSPSVPAGSSESLEHRAPVTEPSSSSCGLRPSASSPAPSASSAAATSHLEPRTSYLSSPREEYCPQMRLDLIEQIPQQAAKSAESLVVPAPVEKIVEKPVQNVESSAIPDHKILGEAFNAFIAVEQNGEIVLIDKHAAHERMIFDRLRQNPGEITSQMLLSPVTMSLSSGDAELIERNGELFSELGYEIELYGENEYIIRGVPAEMFSSDAVSSVEEICEKLRSGISPDPASVRDEALHTVACKAAIKAGWDTQPAELEVLVAAVLSGAVKYCPHGRPVFAVITRADLDRLFKRIV